MTSNEIRDKIKRKLGGVTREGAVGVVVELADEHYDEALDDALSFYNRWMPLHRRGVLATSSTVSQYDVTDVKGEIVEVIPEPQGQITDYEDVFGIARSRVFLSSGQYILALKDFQLQRDIFRTAFDWVYERDPIDGKAFLYITKSSKAQTLSYLYVVAHTYETIPMRDENWFVSYCQALAEIILAKMRGKYTDIPGQQSPISFDATGLKADAATDKSELEGELKSRPKTFLIMQG